MISIIAFVVVSGFFLFSQYRNTTFSVSEKTPSNINSNIEVDAGYFTDSSQRVKYTLDLPENCIEKRDKNQPLFDYKVRIICTLEDFELNIVPQVTDRGGPSLPKQPNGYLDGDNYEWEYRIYDLDNNAASITYTTPGFFESRSGFRIAVIANPYSDKAREYFEKILLTFKVMD